MPKKGPRYIPQRAPFQDGGDNALEITLEKSENY